MPFILGKTVSETYAERVRLTPNVIGHRYKPTYPEAGPVGIWKRVTFREFDSECRLVSYGLKAIGLEPGDRCVILSNTRFEWTLTDIAVLGAGGITVPIYASNTPDDCAYILNHSEAKVAVVEDAKQLEKLLLKRAELKHLQKIVVIEPSGLKAAQGREDVLGFLALKELGRREESRNPTAFEKTLRSAKSDDLMTICYTSGTTGVPKGVMLTQDNVMSVLEDCERILNPYARPEAETTVTFLPYSHIIGKLESMAVFVFGWQSCFAENLDLLMTNIAEAKPTLMFAVPRIFEKARTRLEAMVEQSPPAKKALFKWAMEVGRRYQSALWEKRTPSLPDVVQYQVAKRLVFSKIAARFGGRLQFALCGGAPLPKEIGEYFGICNILILEGYGLTETSAPVALMTPDDVRFGWVGKPLAEVAIKIAEDGEVLVKSRKVFKGYYKNPEATAEVLKDGWFHTGDVGEINADGFLRITDRKKDLIITSAGKNIAPQKIENLAKSQPFINQFVVHGDRRNYLVALVTLDRDAVMQWAKDNQVLFSKYEELVRSPKVQALVQKSIDQLNSGLASFETIKKFMILPQEFTVESGEMTPSLKVKRKLINQRYARELDGLYES
jgi:long-chain acyl-CoA synthetase